MYVWNKRIVVTLLVVFGFLAIGVMPLDEETGWLTTHTTHWLALNYCVLLVWVFVWMYDQARMRGKTIWIWVVPFVIAPLPTLMVFVLVLQRRVT